MREDRGHSFWIWLILGLAFVIVVGGIGGVILMAPHSPVNVSLFGVLMFFTPGGLAIIVLLSFVAAASAFLGNRKLSALILGAIIGFVVLSLL